MPAALLTARLTGVVVCLLGLAPGLAADRPAAGDVQGSPPFQVDTLAEGVWLFRPSDARSARTNSLVIERKDGLLVVDAQPSPEAARELLGSIEKRTAKTIRYLVLSHPHAEAAGGASAFPDDVLVIGSEGCREALQDKSYDFGAEMRLQAPARDAWVEPARRVPMLILFGPTTLADPQNPVEMTPVQQGHSRGDLMLRLAAPGIFHIGGLLGDGRNPYAGDAHIGGWLGILNSLSTEAPNILVSMRGPAADIQAVRSLRDGLAWVRGQVEYGFVEQWPIEEIPARVGVNPDAAKRFDVHASPSFFTLLVERVLEESLEHRRKRGRM